jgi:hypothetical protein
VSLELYTPGEESRPCPGCGQHVPGRKLEARACSRRPKRQGGGMVARPVEIYVRDDHRAPCGLPCDGAGPSQKGVHRSERCGACARGQRVEAVKA